MLLRVKLYLDSHQLLYDICILQHHNITLRIMLTITTTTQRHNYRKIILTMYTRVSK